MPFYGAVPRFRLNSPSGYSIPKPKCLFFVNFVSRFIDSTFLNFTSFYVKNMDRVQSSYNVVELNQYNRKRLVQTKINYEPLSFTMYDIVDDYAMKLIEAHNRFYYGDFQNKDNNSWNYDLITNNFETTPNWGLSANQSPGDSYFFDRIELYEFYDQTYSQTNFINPKFTQVNFQPLDMESAEGNQVTISFKYEGLVIESIAEPMTPELADKFGIQFKSDFGLPNGALRIPGVQSLINTGTNVLTNIFSGLGVSPFISQNLSSALTKQGLSVLGPKLNTGFGKTVFDTIEKTSNVVNVVGTRTATGQVVNDIATGNIKNTFKILGF